MFKKISIAICFFFISGLSFAESKTIIDGWEVMVDDPDSDGYTDVYILKGSDNLVKMDFDKEGQVLILIQCKFGRPFLHFLYPSYAGVEMNDLWRFTFTLDDEESFEVDYRLLRGNRVFNLLDKFTGKNRLQVTFEDAAITAEFDISKMGVPMEEIRKVCSDQIH